MTAPVISANYQELEKIAQQFATQRQQIQRLTQSLMTTVDQLRCGGWVADAANQYYRNMDHYIFPSLKRLNAALGHSSDAILEIVRIFRQAEEDACVGLRNKSIDITAMRRLDGELFVTDSVDGRAIHPSDVQQGQLNDCFFVAPLAALAQQNPDFIRNHILDNGDDSYTVTMYQEKLGDKQGGLEPINIRVEPTFPEGKVTDPVTGKTYTTLHVTTTDVSSNKKPELWPMIYEKAFAQLQAGGDAVEGYNIIYNPGHVIQAMTAMTGQQSIVKNAEEFSIQDLSHNLQQGNIIVIGTEQESKSFDKFGREQKLAPSHAYYVTNVDAKNNTISIRNPWGWEHKEITVPSSEVATNFGEIYINEIAKN